MTLRAAAARFLVIVAALASNAFVAGCIVVQRSDPDPDLVAEVVRFCELSMPLDAVATAASASTWQEDSVSLTAVMPHESVDVLLRDSRIVEPSAPGPTAYRSSPPERSELPMGPAVTSVTERFPDFVRTVVIDRSQASQAVVDVSCRAS